MRRRQARVTEKWQRHGWEFVSQRERRFRPELTFRKARPKRRYSHVVLSTGLALCLVAALVAAAIRWWPSTTDSIANARRDAGVAVQALRDGDLPTLEGYLAANRGDEDFAYYFTAETDPRMLGEALGTVVTESDETSAEAYSESESYQFLIPDLAGALSLAASATGEHALPGSWTADFVTATTRPGNLDVGNGTEDAPAREAQDEANKQNLLLLLANGTWPTSFLKTVTSEYVTFDQAEGANAWPGPQDNGGFYAPAPSGVYLTDGIVALTAALTANPQASAWAFGDFQPGTKVIEGSDYEIGDFTHYLLFEHDYPKGADDTDLGVTVAMTALASAAGETAQSGATATEPGPLHDAEALSAFANDIKEMKENEGRSCSWRVYDCVVTAAKAIAHLANWVWNRVSRWGHLALDAVASVAFVAGAVSSATGVGASVGVPLMFVGVSAEAANAGWYAVEGDYLMAGVSLASVAPGMWFTKLAAATKGTSAGKAVVAAVVASKGATVGRVLETSAPLSERVARVVSVWRKGSTATSAEIAEAGAKNVGTATRPAYPAEKDLQSELAAKVPGAKTEVPMETKCASTCSGNRRVDIYDPATGSCTEIKTGMGLSNKKTDLGEVAKDVMLRTNKTCKSLQWIFGPDKNGVVGPYEELRKELQRNRIPYEILKAAA